MLTGVVRGRLAPDTALIGSLLRAHYLAVANLAGEQATRKVAAALQGQRATRAREAAPPSGQPFTAPWATPATRYDQRKAAGLGPRTVAKPPNPDERTTLQERLALGLQWETMIDRIGFHLRDPDILAQLQQQGTKIRGDVSATMLQDLRDVLAQQFYTEGQSAAAVARDIDKIFPMTYWGRADTIARTETAYAQQLVQHEAFKRDGVPSQEWHCSFRNSRDAHIEADGQTVDVGEPFFVGGEYMLHPMDPTASAENCVNCNCDASPQFPDDTGALPDSPWLGEAGDTSE